jgi:hypothetical protein
MIHNLTKEMLKNGAEIRPLLVPYDLAKGTGQMNPSLFIENDKLLVNVRGVNYSLNHSENKQLFNSPYGPLSYLNPSDDVTLTTTNFFMELSPDLQIRRVSKVDTSKLDVKPIWNFIGLEDARLVKWQGKYYLIGVRRDIKDDGQGRMELSEIEIGETEVKEISRKRFDPPGDPTYCEKNWMPIVDMPFHLVKWTNPTEVVRLDLNKTKAEQTYYTGKWIQSNSDFRGGSNVVPLDSQYRCAVVHEVSLYFNELKQKDADYYHRFILWDKDWNLIKMSDRFNFMDAKIEFCCGLGFIDDIAYITFGFQDNAAYIVKTNKQFIKDMLWKS